jgi:O-antigen ligase
MLNRKITFPVASIRWSPYCSLALIGLIGILPFVYRHHSQPLVSFYSEWLAISLGTTAGLALLTRQFWQNLAIPRSAFYLFALTIIFFLQGVWLSAEYPYAAQWLIPGLYLIWAILLMILATWLRGCLGKEKIVELLAWCFVVGGLLSAFAGLVQYIGFGGWLDEYVVFKQGATIHGNIAQQNHFATHLLLAVSGLCYLFSRRQLSPVLATTLLLFFATLASLSSSRSVFLYAILLCMLSFVNYYKARDTASSRLGIATIFFLVAYVGGQYLLPHIHPWLMSLVNDWSMNTEPLTYDTALNKLSATQSSWELRSLLWHKAWLIFLAQPITGVGIGQFAWHSFTLQTLPEFSGAQNSYLLSNAHNLFMQILAETGAIGLLLLLALIVTWTYSFAKHWTQPDWLIAALLGILFIHSNLEFPLWYSYFLGITAFLLGLGDSHVIKTTISPRAGQIGVGITLTLGVAALTFTLHGYQTLENISLSYSLLSPQEKQDRARTVAKNPILAPYAELKLIAMMPATSDGIEEKLAITTREFHRNPDSYKVYAQVTALALNRQAVDAKELLQKAVLVYPDYLLPYIRRLQRLSPSPEISPLLEKANQLLQATQTGKT